MSDLQAKKLAHRFTCMKECELDEIQGSSQQFAVKAQLSVVLCVSSFFHRFSLSVFFFRDMCSCLDFLQCLNVTNVCAQYGIRMLINK